MANEGTTSRATDSAAAWRSDEEDSTAFLGRAVALTLDPGLRTQRVPAAAQAKHSAGVPATARELPAIAESGPLDEPAPACANHGKDGSGWN